MFSCAGGQDAADANGEFTPTDEFITLGAASSPDAAAAAPVEALADNTARPIWARGDAYHSAFHLALHQEVLDFVAYVEPTPEERAER